MNDFLEKFAKVSIDTRKAASAAVAACQAIVGAELNFGETILAHDLVESFFHEIQSDHFKTAAYDDMLAMILEELGLVESAAPKSPVLPIPAGVATTSDTRPEKARPSTRAGPADGVAGAGKATDSQGISSMEIRPNNRFRLVNRDVKP